MDAQSTTSEYQLKKNWSFLGAMTVQQYSTSLSIMYCYEKYENINMDAQSTTSEYQLKKNWSFLGAMTVQQ